MADGNVTEEVQAVEVPAVVVHKESFLSANWAWIAVVIIGSVLWMLGTHPTPPRNAQESWDRGGER